MDIKILINDKYHCVESKSDESILDSLIREGIDVPYSCRLGYCLVCKCVLESGEISVEDDSSLTGRERSQGYILACQSFAKDDVSINFDFF